MKSDWDYNVCDALADGPDQRMALLRAEGFDCAPGEVTNACEQLSEGGAGLPECRATDQGGSSPSARLADSSGRIESEGPG